MGIEQWRNKEKQNKNSIKIKNIQFKNNLSLTKKVALKRITGNLNKVFKRLTRFINKINGPLSQSL